jgi:hypothetical protein
VKIDRTGVFDMTHMMGFNACFGSFDHYPLIDKLAGTDFAERSYSPVELFLGDDESTVITMDDARAIDEAAFAYALKMVNAAFLAGYKVGRNPDLLLLAVDAAKEATHAP